MRNVIAKIVEEDELVKTMVDRFLSWRLPDSFSPDAGISFTKPEDMYPHVDHPENLWPTGTNLFDADQAKAMVLHLLNGESGGGDE